MTIVYHSDWEIKKGEKDAKRHQEKIDDAIRKGVRDVIGNETIISGKGKKSVRIPVKGLKDYRFVHGNTDGFSGGIGQGDGGAGDVIGRKPKPGQEQGKGGGQGAGQGHGEGDMEVDVDIDYLLDVMFEDLGLPWLDPKKKNSIEIPKGWKFESISKKGVFSRIHKKRTMIEAIKRNVLFTKEIIEQCDLIDKVGEEQAFRDASKALQQAKGDIDKAIEIINSGKLNTEELSGFLIHDDDLRFKQIEEDVEICSKAVVFALMDVSGSMTPDKKYLMKSLLFWMVSWLKKQYEYVDIRFIQHTEIAKEVDEDTFFHGGESGGTRTASAFQKMNHTIDTEYPSDEWNIYCIYCSDGEDWNPKDSLDEIEITLTKKLSMLSYVEVKPDYDLENNNSPYNYGYSTLLPEIQKRWKFQESNFDKKGKFWINNNLKFLLSVIKDKSHIWPCLQFMLGIQNRTPTDK